MDADAVVEMELEPLLKDLPQLLASPELCNGVIQGVLTRCGGMLDGQHDSKMLLRAIGQYARAPLVENTTIYMACEFLLCYEYPHYIIEVLPSLCKTPDESKIVLQSYASMISEDRAFLVPCIAAMSLLPLNKVQKTELGDLCRKSLGIVPATDFPALVRAVLNTMEKDSAIAIFDVIRYRGSDLPVDVCIMVAEMLANSCMAHQGPWKVFQTSIQNTEAASLIDLLMLLTLSSRIRTATAAYELLISALDEARIDVYALTETLFSEMEIASPFVFEIISLSKRLLQSKRDTLLFTQHVAVALRLLELVFTSSRDFRIQTVRLLVGSSLRGHAKSQASSALYRLIRRHSSAFAPFAHVVEESAQQRKHSSIAVAHRLASSIMHLRLLNPSLGSTLTIYVQKTLVGFDERARIGAIVAAAHILRNALEHGTQETAHEVLSWVLQLVSDTPESPRAGAAVLDCLAYACPFLALNRAVDVYARHLTPLVSSLGLLCQMDTGYAFELRSMHDLVQIEPLLPFTFASAFFSYSHVLAARGDETLLLRPRHLLEWAPALSAMVATLELTEAERQLQLHESLLLLFWTLFRKHALLSAWLSLLDIDDRTDEAVLPLLRAWAAFSFRMQDAAEDVEELARQAAKRAKTEGAFETDAAAAKTALREVPLLGLEHIIDYLVHYGSSEPVVSNALLSMLLNHVQNSADTVSAHPSYVAAREAIATTSESIDRLAETTFPAWLARFFYSSVAQLRGMTRRREEVDATHMWNAVQSAELMLLLCERTPALLSTFVHSKAVEPAHDLLRELVSQAKTTEEGALAVVLLELVRALTNDDVQAQLARASLECLGIVYASTEEAVLQYSLLHSFLSSPLPAHSLLRKSFCTHSFPKTFEYVTTALKHAFRRIHVRSDIARFFLWYSQSLCHIDDADAIVLRLAGVCRDMLQEPSHAHPQFPCINPHNTGWFFEATQLFALVVCAQTDVSEQGAFSTRMQTLLFLFRRVAAHATHSYLVETLPSTLRCCQWSLSIAEKKLEECILLTSSINSTTSRRDLVMPFCAAHQLCHAIQELCTALQSFQVQSDRTNKIIFQLLPKTAWRVESFRAILVSMASTYHVDLTSKATRDTFEANMLQFDAAVQRAVMTEMSASEGKSRSQDPEVYFAKFAQTGAFGQDSSVLQVKES